MPQRQTAAALLWINMGMLKLQRRVVGGAEPPLTHHQP